MRAAGDVWGQRLRRFLTFCQSYGWQRGLYRLCRGLVLLLPGRPGDFAVAEIMAATVASLRQLSRLPKALQVRVAGPEEYPRVEPFLRHPGKLADRLAAGDLCVLAVSAQAILATEWIKLGPSAYYEDARELGIVVRVPTGACWLYDGMSAEAGHAVGPWGAVMGRLRTQLEARGIDTVYLQVGYENPYSLRCHESLGFRTIGQLCCLRLGRWRIIGYRAVGKFWTRLPGRSFDPSCLYRGAPATAVIAASIPGNPDEPSLSGQLNKT
jgi:hypothetical protein